MICPACQKEASFRNVEKRQAYSMFQCPICSLVFAWPMDCADSGYYENKTDYKLQHIFAGIIGTNWCFNEFMGEGISGRLLDVGCGQGKFLVMAKEKCPDYTGIDFDKESIKVAVDTFKLKNIYNADFYEFLEKNGAKYDIITFFEVLEHLDNPGKFIKSVRKNLSGNGSIVLSVPNRDRFFDTIRSYDYPPHHLLRWNEASLKYFLELNGFHVIKLRHPLKPADIEGFIGTYVSEKIMKILNVATEKAYNNDKKMSFLLKTAYFLWRKIFLRITGLIVFPFANAITSQGSHIYCLAKIRQ